jgi:hypothetical protein
MENFGLFRNIKRTQLFYLYDGEYLILGAYGNLFKLPED